METLGRFSNEGGALRFLVALGGRLSELRWARRPYGPRSFAGERCRCTADPLLIHPLGLRWLPAVVDVYVGRSAAADAPAAVATASVDNLHLLRKVLHRDQDLATLGISR